MVRAMLGAFALTELFAKMRDKDQLPRAIAAILCERGERKTYGIAVFCQKRGVSVEMEKKCSGLFLSFQGKTVKKAVGNHHIN